MVLVALLQACRGEELADTNKQGAGSYSLISTGEPVRPEKQDTVIGPGNQIKAKAQYARTAIRIAKELGNPEDYETITVSTGCVQLHNCAQMCASKRPVHLVVRGRSRASPI